MQLQEFEHQIQRLRLTYGDKNMPEEREKMFWKRYGRISLSAFTSAVDWIVFHMPPAVTLIEILNQKLDETAGPVSQRLGAARIDELHPIQPNAKELADKYAPAIREMIKKGLTKPLPYDPKERIENV